MEHLKTPWSRAVRREAVALWTLAWPIVLGQLATIGMATSDTVMTGRLNAAELAVVSLGASVWSLACVALVGLIMPVNAMIAHEYGARKPERVAQITQQALYMTFACGLCAMAIVDIGASFFDRLGMAPDLAHRAATFVRVIACGLPALAMYRALYAYSASLNRTKPMMVISFGALAYNLVANWVFIYGHFGAPRWGAFGCAFSTASGLWLMLGVMLWWIRRDPVYREWSPFARWCAPSATQIGAILKLGAPLSLAYIAEVTAFSAIAFAVARFGVTDIAANQIAINVMSVAFVIPLGFGMAVVTRVGQALGEGQPERARFVAFTGLGVAAAIGLACALATGLWRGGIAALYTTDVTVQAAAGSLLLLLALFQVADAMQVCAASAVRGYQETRRPMVIHLTAFWCVALPAGFALGYGLLDGLLPGDPVGPLGARGFWIGLVMGLFVAASLLVRLLDRVSRARLAGPQGVPPAGALAERAAS
jgi:MATE family multidrug resistance protein